MAVRAEDVDALAEAIVHGAEEKLVSELTAALVDDLAAGILDGGDRRTLGALARANRSRIDQALAANRARIAAEVYGEALSCLQEGDARDVAAIEAYYGAGAFAGASGASAGARELAHQTARGLAEIVARQNLAMADAAERLWYEVAGEAIAAKNQGLKPLDRIVADAVCRLAASGFETIDYESGIKSQIDVAVRRHVVSQASQAGGEMTLARLRAVGHDLVVTSAHYGARPSHAEWQGRPCCVSGPKAVGGVQYPGLAALTGYGTVGGLKGVNCRHSIGPYFPGVTELPDLSFPRESERFGLASEQYYDALQRQRELERRVRGGKREIAAMERAGIGLENPKYVQKRLLLDRRQGALRSHCASTGLVRNYPREKAYGIGAQPRALRGASAKAYVSRMRGRANVVVDRFVPCLLDAKTGELVDTQVYRLSTRSQLKGYNSKTGWDINWEKVPKGIDVYGLTIKGQSELQGLVALKADADAQAVYLHYAKTAPRNDKRATGKQDYEGVGGHLFALAVEISEKAGFGGYLYGFAEDAKLERHYIEKLGAMHVGALHPFHFAVDETAAKRLLKEYNYEWK